MSEATTAKTRLLTADGTRMPAIADSRPNFAPIGRSGYRSTRKPLQHDGLDLTYRSCAARETGWPGSRPPGAVRAADEAGSAVDWDPARRPCGRGARSHDRAVGSQLPGQGR